ncbi:unnamed protein product [Adineta ricciae]|uniref:G-protein coupled receptors family 1 profile domain-containing protein n=1 Tax=Adineta ricciae TaxID=249248 RepID=A0A815I3U6_ADIRI|nr:unnamed protein product [Adineta ricciae]CAF1363224.1 unnamed protein product [Adineta ricciae]
MANVTDISISSSSTISIFADSSSLDTAIWIATVGACFAYGLGFFGNLLSLVVFYSQEEFRKISTGLLFLLITIANLFHLWTLLTEFLTTYGISMFQHIFFQCRLTYFIQNVSRAMSTYFMVAVAIDRLIRTEFPARSKTLCTRRNVILITVIFFIFFSLFWSFYLYPMPSVTSQKGSCTFTYTSTFNYFLGTLYIPIRAVLVCFIPLITMLLANIRMIFNIRQSQRRVTNQITGGSSRINQPVPSASSSVGRPSRRMTALDRMLFYMMFANVLTFLISQVPLHTFMWIRNSLAGYDDFTLSFIRTVLLIWSSLYFGVAFYFYCLASPLFREKFVKIICFNTNSRSTTNIPMTSK